MVNNNKKLTWTNIKLYGYMYVAETKDAVLYCVSKYDEINVWFSKSYIEKYFQWNKYGCFYNVGIVEQWDYMDSNNKKWKGKQVANFMNMVKNPLKG